MRHPLNGERNDPLRRLLGEGFRTMHAIHDAFTPQLRNRLQTSVIGLGLVRLLLDSGRTKEARTTLASLQNGYPSAQEAIRPLRKRRWTRRVKSASAC
jgi:hypothetical protein